MRTERSDNKKMEEEGSSSGCSSGGNNTSGSGSGKGYISYYTGKKYEDLLISFSFPREFYI